MLLLSRLNRPVAGPSRMQINIISSALLLLICLASTVGARTWVVQTNHPKASDSGQGTAVAPLRTISRAATLAAPGDVILVRAGVYREHVSPERGGEEGKPITYMAAPGEAVFIRGSDEFRPAWRKEPFKGEVYSAPLQTGMFGAFNPFHLDMNYEPSPGNTRVMTPKKARPAEPSAPLPLTRGQVYVDNAPLNQASSLDELSRTPGSWMVDAAGDRLHIHFPPDRAGRPPAKRLVELTKRMRIFAPRNRGLGYITLKGFILEHAANNHPTPQIGAVSTRSGHHWVIEQNTIRYANTIGLDIGSEWGIRGTEEDAPLPPGTIPGYHMVRDNHISDNGLCGIAGLGHMGVQILGNTLERNNRLAFRTWEVGAIKFHFSYYALIEGNLIRDTDGFGIWIDNTYFKDRITRNVILNSYLAGVFVELGQGPILVDNNVIAYTRHGDGVYAHDAAGITVAHNLIYSNAHYGVWSGIATDRKMRGGTTTSSNQQILNNLIFSNGAGAISLPFPFERASNNFSDGNLFMAGGSMSGKVPPEFQLNDSGGRVSADVIRDQFRSAGIDPASQSGPFRLSLEQWRKVSGNDAHSLTTKLDKDMLGTFANEIRMNFLRPAKKEDFIVAREATSNDVIDELWRTRTVAVDGMDSDFLGTPFPKGNALPGPFQAVEKGPNRFVLWPVSIQGKGYPLKPGEKIEVPEYFTRPRGQ